MFIVGVGRYRHLLGGASPTPGAPPLGQLTSPPISARALARWFTSPKFANAHAPLGSLEMLLSDSTGQIFDGVQVDDATSDKIQTAFDAWKQRCHADPGNIAFFYFCGHGLQKDVVALLPEDFAASENNLWKHSIDFDKTYVGMVRCRAGTQFFVVDACRELSQTAIKDEEFGGTALISPRLGDSHLRTAPKLFATALGRQAFGDSNGVSRLTGALIECLDGLGATDDGPEWVINTTQLGIAVQSLVRHQNEVLKIPENNRQIVDPAGGDLANGPQRLLVFPAGSSPTVIVKFGCNPSSIAEKVTFFAVPENGPKLPAPNPGPWITTVSAGLYVFGCSFNLAAGPSDVPAPRVFVRPPIYHTQINVPPPHPV
ncbi:hypothetical protein LMTR3_09875 [Bradyrhizobium sp. LMTR 3]|nr:hypothetical protein LMTR3_09875 [Bradyrhizobium sp. LMTR 3]